MHEFEQKFNVHKRKTIWFNKSYRLLTILLVLNSHTSSNSQHYFLNHTGSGADAVWLLIVTARQRRVIFFDFTLWCSSGQFSTAMDISAFYWSGIKKTIAIQLTCEAFLLWLFIHHRFELHHTVYICILSHASSLP